MLGPAAPFLWFLLLAGGVRVETATPDALCPDPAQVRASIGDRLGALEGTGEWAVVYGVVHHPEEPSGDALRLELRDPRQRVRLRRELPRQGESCAAMAQAIAIIVDNYFRRPGGAGAADDGDTAASGVRAGPVARAAPAATSPTGTTDLAAGAPRVTAGMLVGWAGAARESSASVSLGAGVAVLPSWIAGFDLTWLTAPERQALDATTTVTARSGIARGSLARRWRAGAAVDLWLGPELVAAIDRAQAPGLGGASTQWRAGWGAGVHAGAAGWIAPRVGLWLALAIDVTPAHLAGDFVVHGYPGPILTPPQARAAVDAGVLFAFFR